MQEPHARGRVEDYTNASLVMIFVNLIWMLALVWIQFGFLWLLIVALVLNHLITRLGMRLAALEEARAWPKKH